MAIGQRSKPCSSASWRAFRVLLSARTSQPATGRINGFVLFRAEIEDAADRNAMTAIVQQAAGVDSKLVSTGGKAVHVLMAKTASVSKIERELAKENDEFGPGAETRSVISDMQARLLKHGPGAASPSSLLVRQKMARPRLGSRAGSMRSRREPVRGWTAAQWPNSNP